MPKPHDRLPRRDALFCLVYDELRGLASLKLAGESPSQTLNATALVHEAYLRLHYDSVEHGPNDRGRFFAAAAEAMRRILIDRARQRHAQKRGGLHRRRPLDDDAIAEPARPIDELLALDDALNALAANEPEKAELVKLRYFAGLTLADAAQALQISHNTADRWWAYAKAFLYHEMTRSR